MKTGPNHLPRIDILRAIAVLLVFNSHFLAPAGYALNSFPSVMANTILSGSLGVSLFFVISGLCIRLSHLSTSTFSTPHFYWRRFWRIFPPYLLSLVLLVLFYRAATTGDILAHVFLVHNFTTGYFKTINAPFWSLALEFQVYLLYPVLLLLHKRFGARITGSILCLASVGSYYLGGKVLRNLFHLPDWFTIANQLPLILWFSWYLGFLVADAIVARKAISIYWHLILVMSICLYAVCHSFRSLGNFGAVIDGAVLALLVWEFLSWNTRSGFSLFGKAVATLGACSYSFYIYHDVLIAPCLKLVRHFITSPVWVAGVGYPVTLLIVFAISYFGYRTVEMKSLALGRHYYEKWLRPRRKEAVQIADTV